MHRSTLGVSFPKRLGSAAASLVLAMAVLGIIAPSVSAAPGCLKESGLLTVTVASSTNATRIAVSGSGPDSYSVAVAGVAPCTDGPYSPVSRVAITTADGTSTEVVTFDFSTELQTMAAVSSPAGLTVDLKGGNDKIVVVGTSGQDTINGAVYRSTNVEELELQGAGDNDTLLGGSIATTFIGGAGNDNMSGGIGNDVFDEGTAANGADVMYGGGGTDTVDYSGRTTGGGASNKVYVTIGSGANDGDPSPGEHDDVQTTVENVIGTSNNDELTGDGANNVLVGGPGADKLVGGAGSDAASYEDSPAGVTIDLSAVTPTGVGGDAAGDTLFTGIERILGSAYVDVLTGNASANTISGGAGNDRIEGAGGADVLDGGLGSGDTVLYTASSVGVSVNLSTGAGKGGDAEGDFLADFENLTGSVKGDLLVGNSGANVLDGSYGDDTLEGLGGADVLNGGNGSHDRASYDASATAVTVSLLAGTAKGGDAEGDELTKIEDLTGSDFADMLVGSRVANNISGGDGNDMISGGLGNDAIDGGAGKDTVGFASAIDGVTVSLRYGKATGGDGSDTLTSVENAIGSAYADDISGGRGVNVINGGGGSDRISGSDGNDRLYGGTGNDTLVGGAGDDVLAGGGGDDKLDAGDGTDSCNAGPGKNTLVSCEKLK